MSDRPHVFTTVLVGDMGPHKWTCAIIENSPALFGTGRSLKVNADVEGATFTTSLLPYRGTHMLPVKQAVLDQIGKQAGDAVTITLTGAAD